MNYTIPLRAVMAIATRITPCLLFVLTVPMREGIRGLIYTKATIEIMVSVPAKFTVIDISDLVIYKKDGKHPRTSIKAMDLSSKLLDAILWSVSNSKENSKFVNGTSQD